MVVSTILHLVVDGTCHDVTGSQGKTGVVFLHELFAIHGAQYASVDVYKRQRHEWLLHICGFPSASGRAILPTICNCHQVQDYWGDEEQNTCHLSSVQTMHNLYYAVGISSHAVYSFSNHWCESVQPLQLPMILL